MARVRVLTTHVGSLPRPQEVVDVIFTEDKGQPVDAMSTTATYIRHRLSGFEIGDVPRATPADLDA